MKNCAPTDEAVIKTKTSDSETLVILIKGTNIAIPTNDIIADMDMNLVI